MASSQTQSICLCVYVCACAHSFMCEVVQYVCMPQTHGTLQCMSVHVRKCARVSAETPLLFLTLPSPQHTELHPVLSLSLSLHLFPPLDPYASSSITSHVHSPHPGLLDISIHKERENRRLSQACNTVLYCTADIVIFKKCC